MSSFFHEKENEKKNKMMQLNSIKFFSEKRLSLFSTFGVLFQSFILSGSRWKAIGMLQNYDLMTGSYLLSISHFSWMTYTSWKMKIEPKITLLLFKYNHSINLHHNRYWTNLSSFHWTLPFYEGKWLNSECIELNFFTSNKFQFGFFLTKFAKQRHVLH